ncbi:transcriptional regulator [Nitratireductor aquibiodomus]|uniref:Transcriptional regulator n=1 Tax=Nitratireductor aquibiodomus TaxID=204799 RepID=A0A1H4L2B6_9HYPH|nr:LysR family transcriptional regulator [Nitratireductor aquibiodomus]SEB64929.1 transcriptional regulator [Nitratireductor aquibiodomus]
MDLYADIPNLKHLQALEAIGATHSITRACEQLNLSQPALTQGIAKIETQLGVKLFNRRRGMVMTEPGEVYLKRMCRGTHYLRRAGDYAARFASKAPPHLHRRFTLSQLRALIAVVEHESFRLGAQQLAVQQSTVHRSCRELEAQLTCQLFERTSAGIKPTRQAVEFSRLAKLALGEFAQAQIDIQGWKGSFAGRFAIGCLPLAKTSLLPGALMQLTEEYPMLDIIVVDAPYLDLSKALRHGDIDIIIGALRRARLPPELVQEELFVDPLIIVGRSGHPLLSGEPVTPQRLAEYPWVAPRAGAPARDYFDNFYAALQRPDGDAHPIETGSLTVLRGLLMNSDRLTIISAGQVDYEIKLGLLSEIVYPLKNSERSIGVTMREGWLPAVPQQRLLEHLKALVAKI